MGIVNVNLGRIIQTWPKMIEIYVRDICIVQTQEIEVDTIHVPGPMAEMREDDIIPIIDDQGQGQGLDLQ